MPTQFSKELVDRTIKYYAEMHDHHIDKEKVNEYLDSMAGLYLAFADMVEYKEE